MAQPHTRRKFLKRSTAAGVGVTALAGCLGDDDDGAPDDETIRIGALQPLSGDLEYYGRISLMGLYSGLAYKHDLDPLDHFVAGEETIEVDDGPDIDIVLQDTEFVPDRAQSVAEDLVLDEDVDMLFGTSSSDGARQVISTVIDETDDVPFIVGPAADGDITVSDEHCRDMVFRASEHTGMDARAGGNFVAEQGDVSNVAIFAAEGAFGEGVANGYQEVLEAQGVTVQEPRFVEQGFSEFGGLFDEAIDNGADGVVGGFTFITLPEFLSTAVQFDVQVFGGFAALVTTQIIGETIQGIYGDDFTAQDIEDDGLGPFTTRYHWNQYDNPINDDFIDMHTDAYGIVPDLFSAGTFVAGSAIVQGSEEAESADPVDIADAMNGMTVEDTPKGEDAYTFQEHNNQAASEMTVAWPVPTSDEFADTWDAAVMPGEPVERRSADEVMVPPGDASCDL